MKLNMTSLSEIQWTAQEDAFLLTEGSLKSKTWSQIAETLNKPMILCYKRYSSLRKTNSHKCTQFFTTKQKESIKTYFVEKYLAFPGKYPAFNIQKLYPICEDCACLFKKELKVVAMMFYRSRENKDNETKLED